jgi:cell division protein FtsL
VAPAERVRRRLTPATGVVLTALLFVTLFAIAIAHALLVQGQIRLDGLDDKLTVEQARYQRLRTEVAEMESPARIVAAAQELGMVSPQDLVYLQPEAVEPQPVDASEPPSTADGSAVRGGDAVEVDGGTGHEWAVMKPLLESPAP